MKIKLMRGSASFKLSLKANEAMSQLLNNFHRTWTYTSHFLPTVKKHVTFVSIQMLVDPNFDRRLNLPNITGIACSTFKFIHNVGSHIFGYFGLEKKKILILRKI